jgi:hypothetical protein
MTNVRRTSSILEAFADYNPLPPYIPLKEEDPEEPNPDKPSTPPTRYAPWDPVDWPQDGPKAPTSPLPSPAPARPSYTIPYTPWNIKIRCVPSAITMDADDGPITGSTILEKYIDISTLGGFCDIMITFSPVYAWFGAPTSNGGIVSTLWIDGSLGSHEAHYGFSIDPTTMPAGTYTIPVTFTLMSSVGLGTYTPLIGKDGQPITAVCTITAHKNPPLYTGALKVSGSYITSDGASYGPDIQNIGLTNTAGQSPPVVMSLFIKVYKLAVDTDGIPAGTTVISIQDNLFWTDPSIPRWGSPTCLSAISSYDTSGCPTGTVVKYFTQGGFMPGPHEVTFTYTYTFGPP